MLLGVAAAWVGTLAVIASLTAGLYAFVVYSPSLPAYEGTRPADGLDSGGGGARREL